MLVCLYAEVQSLGPPERGARERLFSIQGVASFQSLGPGCVLPPRIPNEFFQITAPGLVEFHTLAFKHSLLLVRGQHHPTRRAFALRVDHAMPGRFALVGPMHDKPDGARRVSFAKHVCDLPVSHHAATRNATNDFVDAFTVLRIWCRVFFFHSLERSQHGTSWSAIAGAFGNFQRQTNQFVIARRHVAEIQSFQNHNALRKQRYVRAVITRMKLFD